jgi:hypothetical protein
LLQGRDAVAIPQPPPSEEGQAGNGDYLRELRNGLSFITGRPALLRFMLYLEVNNFLLNGTLDLMIPYSISVTGSEAQTGLVLGLMSLGALAGGLLAATVGGWRPRMRLILLGTCSTGFVPGAGRRAIAAVAGVLDPATDDPAAAK